MSDAKGRVALALTVITLAVAIVTAIVFLLRAGDPGAANWPETWELRSSDNGSLFQMVGDFFAGRPLEWTFGPQLGLFPELPISVVAYLGSGANVYVYYLLVACLNNAILFLGLYLLARTVWPEQTWHRASARAALATSPLVLLPLVGTSWLVSFHLAPAYYFGMYLVLIAAPSVFFIRSPRRRAVVAVVIALCVASNPLALVFAGPGLAVAVLVRAAGSGWRSAIRPVVIVAAVVGLAAFVRLVLLSPLRGKSPLAYVDATVFAERLRALPMYFAYLMSDRSTAVILVVGAILAVSGLVLGIYGSVRYLRGNRSPRLLVMIYFGLVPLLGAAATYVIMITHYLYSWPVFIAPYVFTLLLVRGQWVRRALAVVPVAFLAIALGTGSIASIGHPERYFGYRSAETTCIDDSVPSGVTTGYATFSDARRLSLTSARGIGLVPLETDASVSVWTTNLAYPRTMPGSFFYINRVGDELPIDVTEITSLFGAPDQVVDCSDNQQLLIYTSPSAQAAIARYYRG